MRLSVIIPVAPYHESNLQKALNSCKAQTEPVMVYYAVDHDKLGPGVIRNRLLEQVRTPYVTFLDADDWIHPQFAQLTCDAMQRGRYVYTDWMQDDIYKEAPEHPWCFGTWHPITAVVWTQDARNVSGFDENLEALEDTDFWLKITTRRICGIRINKPLFYYGKDGQRGIGAQKSGLASTLLETIMQRYGGKMGCCGDKSIDTSQPVGERLEGDVLAMALWRGNRPVRGMATGRRYPRMSYPRVTWVAPADIQKRPHDWQEIVDPTIDAPPMYNGVGELSDALQATGFFGSQPEHTPVIAEPGQFNPDIATIVRVAEERLK
jgi:hypothetical protein